MNVNERDEITASVAAHAELGPHYDNAVAEGLVDRIGDEIDKRIDARLGGQPWPGQPAYQGPPGYQGPAAPTPARAAAAPPPPVVQRRPGSVSGVFLGLGSLGLGVGATAVVAGNHPGSLAEVLMVLLIWAAIAVINIAHSQRKL